MSDVNALKKFNSYSKTFYILKFTFRHTIYLWPYWFLSTTKRLRILSLRCLCDLLPYSVVFVVFKDLLWAVIGRQSYLFKRLPPMKRVVSLTRCPGEKCHQKRFKRSIERCNGLLKKGLGWRTAESAVWIIVDIKSS